MKAILLGALLMAAPSSSAETQVASDSSNGVHVGLLVGEPIGVSAHAAVLGPLGVQAAIGQSTRADARLLIALDVVWALPDVFGRFDDTAVIVRVGGGGRYATDLGGEGPTRYGLRASFGLAYQFFDRDLEMFADVAPGLSLNGRKRASIDGGFGMRVRLF